MIHSISNKLPVIFLDLVSGHTTPPPDDTRKGGGEEPRKACMELAQKILDQKRIKDQEYDKMGDPFNIDSEVYGSWAEEAQLLRDLVQEFMILQCQNVPQAMELVEDIIKNSERVIVESTWSDRLLNFADNYGLLTAGEIAYYVLGPAKFKLPIMIAGLLLGGSMAVAGDIDKYEEYKNDDTSGRPPPSPNTNQTDEFDAGVH